MQRVSEYELGGGVLRTVLAASLRCSPAVCSENHVGRLLYAASPLCVFCCLLSRAFFILSLRLSAPGVKAG